MLLLAGIFYKSLGNRYNLRNIDQLDTSKCETICQKFSYILNHIYLGMQSASFMTQTHAYKALSGSRKKVCI